MKPRYKVTGCARFFIFFLFFAPAVFFGAAYLRGENGLQIIKEFVGRFTGKDNERPAERDPETKPVDETSAELRRELDAAREEIRALKEKVADQQMEIDRLKKGQQ